MTAPRDEAAVSIKDLEIPYGVIAPNIWGNLKPQPALLSINLSFRYGIGTAADTDSLDQTTIHYGDLAKRIRASCTNNQNVDQLFQRTSNQVMDMSIREDGKFRVSKVRTQITLPKASMHGECVTLSKTSDYGEGGYIQAEQKSMRFAGMKLMTLIGVNDYERTARQPLIVDFEMSLEKSSYTYQWAGLAGYMKLERYLAELIFETAFQTLESLVIHVLNEICITFDHRNLPAAEVRMKLSKPRAIPFADSPSIELTRDLRARRRNNARLEVRQPRNFDGDVPATMNIIKPYV